MVVCEPNDLDEAFQDCPVVIFEVISESTARTDREGKLRAYQTIATLRVYAVVESERVRITCHRRQDAISGWTTGWLDQHDGNLLLPAAGCTLAVEALYARSGL